jgi:hypothetical protein
MTDIPSLIERLRTASRCITGQLSADCETAANELERRAAPPQIIAPANITDADLRPGSIEWIEPAVSSLQGEFQTTPETVTKENAKAQLERRMWELIDLFAVFFGDSVDPRIWEHLLIYAPKSPLPGEIAELLDWAHKAITVPMNHADYPGRLNLIESLVAALKALVREVERLEEVQKSCHRDIIRQDARISELEAEQDDMAEVGTALMKAIEYGCKNHPAMDGWHPAQCPSEIVVDLLNQLDEVTAERDAIAALNKSLLAHNGELLRELGASTAAIAAKTIEECAKEAEWFLNVEKFTAGAVAQRIRALAQKADGGE